MRSFLVTVQVILIVAGLGVGGFVGYRAIDLIGKKGAALELQADLVLAVLALMLVVAAGVVRPRERTELSAPAPQRRAPNQPPYQPPPGGYRPGGPPTGPQPPIGQGGPHTGQQPPIGPGGPHTGPQPTIGGPDPYGGRTEQYPRGS